MTPEEFYSNGGSEYLLKEEHGANPTKRAFAFAKAYAETKKEGKDVPMHPTPEETRRLWPSLRANNLHDAYKWQLLEELFNHCNARTIEKIHRQHVQGVMVE